MMLSIETRFLLRQISGLVTLFVILCVMVIYLFTHRTADQIERERAQVMLQRIYDLEMAYQSENGTYLPIDREINGDILRLNQASGQFVYQVQVSGNQFVATAKADLNGDGQDEIWQIDPSRDQPIQIQAD